MDAFDIDKVLNEIGGFGIYQIRRYVLFCLILIFATFPTLSYIFTTRNPNYRCRIDECDGQEQNPTYKPDWLIKAVPFQENEPTQCLKFKQLYAADYCNDSLYDTNETVKCHKFVYENPHDQTIANDFHLFCDENLWKLTIVGTINNIGFIAGLPLSGYISDRFGRRTMMLVSVLASTIFGLMKSFSSSYVYFTILEFLDMCFGAGAYSATYILGMELLTTENRVMGSTIMSCAFALGEALMGVIAWITQSWRLFLRILYVPGFLFVSYYWITDESVRWMVSNDQTSKAKSILKKIARENKSKLRNSTIKQLNIIKEETSMNTSDSFIDVFRSPILFLRLVNCSFAWICCTFVYYGLTMHSVGISGNVYINFIAVSLIEIPAYIAANFALSRIGRKLSLSFSFIISAIACVGFVFTPENDENLRLFLFLLGKFSATIAYAAIYLYTTEMFPTSLRHSFMSCCSMFGRIGSMVAPQVPILAKVSKSLPLTLFAAMASSAGLLSLLFPETLNVELPDTIADAIHIGKHKLDDKEKA